MLHVEPGYGSAGQDVIDGSSDAVLADGRTESEILQQFRARLATADKHQSGWRVEARDHYDAVAGRQWDADDLERMRDQQRPAVTFNLLAKFIDIVVGLQINNRQDIRYYPREVGDAAHNDQLTAAAEWARDLCDASVEETDAFTDCLVCGLGWMEWYLDTTGDAGPLPAGIRVDPLQMYYDPAARRRGLADRNWQIRVRRVPREEYRDMFGEEPPEAGAPELGLVGEDGGLPAIIPANQDYGDGEPGVDSDATGIVVADYQWRSMVRGKRVTAVLPGEQQPTEKFFTTAEWAKLEPVMRAAGTRATVVDALERRYWRAFIVPGGVRRAGPSPSRAGFTIHPITGRRDRNTNTWYGVARAMADPQKWTNKFFSSILFTLMSNAKGGVMAEEGAFSDQRKAEASWATPNSITTVAPGALTEGRIKEKPMAQYPQGMDRLMQFSIDSLPAVSGLNVEIMGMADRVQPGVVEAQRKQSAMAIIAWAFDAMRLYYRSAGRQIACYIADYVPAGTLVRVLGENGAQYAPLVKDRAALPFDVVVDEAPTSVNMKERVWLVLEAMMPQLLQAGIPIPKEVLDYSPLPSDLAQKWKQMMQPDPAKQQAQSRTEAASIAKLEGEAAEKQASAGLKQAQTAKTVAETHTEKVAAIKVAAEAGAAQASQ